jgi:hypothetical protein
LLVEEAGRRGIPLMDALDLLKESSAHEPESETPSEEAVARKNEQSVQELQNLLSGVN